MSEDMKGSQIAGFSAGSYRRNTPASELVAVVRKALTMDAGTIVERQHTKGIAALTELAERLEAAERLHEGYYVDAQQQRERAEAAERELPEKISAATEKARELAKHNYDRAEAAESLNAELVRFTTDIIDSEWGAKRPYTGSFEPFEEILQRLERS